MSESTSGRRVRMIAADQLTVEIYPTVDDLAHAAARRTAEFLRETLARQSEARVVFACAASQVRFLAALTAMDGLNWSRVTCFHMDEYLGIEAEHPASFRRFLREHVIRKANPRTVHYLQGDAAEPLTECDRYTALLRDQPVDVCCLGIGENGHLAFNDPPVADFRDPRTVKLVQLDKACRQQQVGEGAFPQLDAVPRYAFTLTIPALCAARRMICVVPERRKAEAVRRALRGPVSPACPASFLRPQPHCTLYLDSDSAGLLG